MTLTPSPAPTATLTLTPTPHPAQVFAEPILAVIANVKPFFADDFSKNRGWISEQYDEIGIKDGLIRATGKGGIFFPPHVHTFPDQKNVVLAFDVRLLNASAVFTTYVRQRDASNHYQISIRGDGNWNFNGKTELVSGRTNSFRAGDMNHIVVLARDDQFAVFLNDRPLFYVRNSDHPKAGRCVNIQFDGAGELDNLQLWDLDQVKGLP
jgi:hypothetical protein